MLDAESHKVSRNTNNLGMLGTWNLLHKGEKQDTMEDTQHESMEIMREIAPKDNGRERQFVHKI